MHNKGRLHEKRSKLLQFFFLCSISGRSIDLDRREKEKNDWIPMNSGAVSILVWTTGKKIIFFIFISSILWRWFRRQRRRKKTKFRRWANYVVAWDGEWASQLFKYFRFQIIDRDPFFGNSEPNNLLDKKLMVSCKPLCFSFVLHSFATQKFIFNAWESDLFF